MVPCHPGTDHSNNMALILEALPILPGCYESIREEEQLFGSKSLEMQICLSSDVTKILDTNDFTKERNSFRNNK